MRNDQPPRVRNWAKQCGIGKVVKSSPRCGTDNLLCLNRNMSGRPAGSRERVAVVAKRGEGTRQGNSESDGKISSQIARIQNDTSGAVKAIQEISAVIIRFNDISVRLRVADRKKKNDDANDDGSEMLRLKPHRGSNEIARHYVVCIGAEQTHKGASKLQASCSRNESLAASCRVGSPFNDGAQSRLGHGNDLANKSRCTISIPCRSFLPR